MTGLPAAEPSRWPAVVAATLAGRAKAWRRGALMLAAGLLTGCLGPTAIRQGFQDYSQTLHYNAQQQMLQNLVRLKYRETPFFLKVGALSVNYELQVGATLGIADLRDGNSPVSLEAEPSVLEKPTVTYTPVEGDVFVRQMLAEMDSGVFVLLVRAGWNIKTLCLLVVESVTGADGRVLDDAAFIALADTLASAQQQQTLDIITKPDGTVQLQAGARQFPLARFRFRGFLDVMYELSKNVQVPASQQDWTQPANNSNGLIQVHASAFKPDDDYVSVKHHGHYFSIAQQDVRSKDTFALLQILYQMQAGDIKSVQPVLTLPIGN